MARVLLAWELGAGTGHLQNIGALAGALEQRGHEVLVAAREPAAASLVFADAPLRYVQAPYWSGSVRGMPPAANYAELLLRVGYGDATTVHGLLRAWLELFDLYRPDWLVAEHAPTALVAARVAALPAARIGSGFMIPPAIAPMPDLQPWTEVPAGRLQAAERTVVQNVDAALEPLGGIGPRDVTEMLVTRADYLSTFEELDHYGTRIGPCRYWGTLQMPRTRPAPEWPPGDGPKLFGYMNAGLDHFDGVIRSLRGSAFPTLVVAHGVHPSKAAQLSGGTLHVQPNPVDLPAVAREAALAFGHGGHGTVAELLRNGLPMLMLPQFLEHGVLAWRVSRAGLAYVPADGSVPEPNMPRAVAEMLQRPDIITNARAFAERYREHDRGVQVEAIVDDLLARML